MKTVKNHSSRRAAIRSMFAAILGGTAGIFGVSRAESSPGKKVKLAESESSAQPLIAQHVVHGNLVFVKGMGAHDEPDIKKATTIALDQIERELENAGSSMNNALQATVFLANIRDYDAMNEAYRGRFGDNPPVRSTVACYKGIPGNSLVEIDCIAALQR
ncbi:MAG: RidA family protein [Balneolaceae bacterium]|nr:RidA family protein [Balneolaceae bacterium]